jgi:putative SOS response-associated peptidase YedK
MLFGPERGELMGLVGLWFQEGVERSSVIVTTSPDDLVRPIHGRMPAVLDREGEDLWLDPDRADP